MAEKSHRALKILLVIFLLLATAAGFFCCYAFSRFGSLPDMEAQKRFVLMTNFQNGLFQNFEPVRLNPAKIAKKSGFLRFLLSSPHAPKEPVETVPLVRRSFPEKPERFSICWLGHSSLILELGGRRILLDPVFGNAAPLPGIVRRHVAPPLPREELPELDFVLISHDHYDHLEYETIRSLSKLSMPIVTSAGVGSRLRSWGIPPSRIIEMSWGDTIKIHEITVRCHPARHFSGRTWSDRNRTLWSSFSFDNGQKKVFFGGDGGYGRHFRAIGQKYGPFDLVCLEIDAWNENWPDNHSFPQQVAQEFRDLKGKVLLPVHWGVFDLAGHPYYESIGHIRSLAQRLRIPLLVPKQGERVRMP